MLQRKFMLIEMDINQNQLVYPQETLVARILNRAAASTEKRADDNEETLKTRIATFRENTEKILVQYPTKLKRLDAERDVDPIFAEVIVAIDETLAKKASA